jgi:hypothetical protein
MMSMLVRLKRLGLLLLCVLMPATASAATAPVAVLPLLNVSQGPNGIDIPFTTYLIDRLAEKGVEATPLGTVISFLAHNRIRTAGRLESYHIRQVHEELGAAFVLLGSVVQSKEGLTPSLGLTLSLVRTYDARTIWSYAGALNRADILKPLGIGEASSVADLQALIADDLLASWPADAVSQEQQSSATIDSMVLEPKVVRPGAEIHATVRLRNLWPEGRTPRAFFRSEDQVHASSFSPAGNSYEATWIAGEKDGRFPVNLVLEWPLYGRTEALPLGSYFVDGTQPLVALDLKGEVLPGEIPVFREKVMIVPSLIVRKPIARWRVTIKDSTGRVAASQEENGNIPARLTWAGGGSNSSAAWGWGKEYIGSSSRSGTRRATRRRPPGSSNGRVCRRRWPWLPRKKAKRW